MTVSFTTRQMKYEGKILICKLHTTFTTLKSLYIYIYIYIYAAILVYLNTDFAAPKMLVKINNINLPSFTSSRYSLSLSSYNTVKLLTGSSIDIFSQRKTVPRSDMCGHSVWILVTFTEGKHFIIMITVSRRKLWMGGKVQRKAYECRKWCAFWAAIDYNMC
jgi:heme/copper-type cytochrome/quinol oxidase subunit 3